MAAGRPPRAAVRAAVRACLRDLDPGDRVVVALSGGADSLALTAAAVAVSAEIGLLCEAAVIDHQLQDGSGEVAARAAEQARILGCSEARVLAVVVPQGSGAGGVEAAARAARYAALDAVAGAGAGAGPGVGAQGAGGRAESASNAVPPAAAILLGHTRDDQAETVLLGLARGSGTRSLAGMAARTGVYRRPLLELPRDVVLAAALQAAAADPRLAPWTDPHNADAGFARVRVRRQVLPVLEGALGPGVVAALARTATLAREDADALDTWADQVWSPLRRSPNGSAPARGPGPQQLGNVLPQEQQEPSEQAPPAAPAPPAGAADRGAGGTGPASRPVGALPIEVLVPAPHASPDGRRLPPAIVNRVVRRFLLDAGCPRDSLTAGHIRAVAAMLDLQSPASAEVALPGGRRARREAGAVVVRV